MSDLHISVRRSPFRRFTAAIAALGCSFVVASAANPQSVPTDLTQYGSGFRMQLYRKSNGQPLANQLVKYEIVYKVTRKTHSLGSGRTDSRGVIGVTASNDILKVVFHYPGSGTLQSCQRTDASP